MRDNEQVDDLLDVVEGLGVAEEELEQNLANNRQKQNDLQDASAEAKVDSSLLALEAAKAAQDAATQSQEAAHASLKLSEKMREHTDELSNANFNWRQSVRNAGTQLSDSKKMFVSMMIITLILALAAIGLIGAIYYNLNNKQEQLKGEILDIIQTENALFKRDLSVKIDDLAAQIEASRFYVEKLAAGKPEFTEHTDTAQSNQSAPPTSAEENSEAHSGMADGAIHANEEIKTAEVAEPSTHSIPSSNVANTITTQQLEQVIHNQLQPVFANLNEQVQVLSKQQKLLSTAIAQLNKNAAKPPESTANNISQLNSKQSQQLADIRWLVSKHDKHLKTISEQLEKIKSTPVASATDGKSQQRLEQQFSQMQTQQKLIEEQLTKLQENIELIMKRINEDKPYSYKAK
jgi:predicted  nucleic acid-binding Zn-ribbon protein